MRLRICTNNHQIITSDVLTFNKEELADKVGQVLFGEGYLSFYVENLLTFIPYSMLSNSIIQIVEDSDSCGNVTE